MATPPSERAEFVTNIVFESHAGRLNPGTNQVFFHGTLYDSVCDFARLLRLGGSHGADAERPRGFINPLCAGAC